MSQYLKNVKNTEVDEYDLSFDCGTGSVGWCVTDVDGNLLSFKGKPMWGSRLFESGETAETRRNFRSARRRLARRIQRILWLQGLVGTEVLRLDPDFFIRMKYSSWSKKDCDATVVGSNRTRASLFGDSDSYCSQLYNAHYPTIYHLRSALATKDQKFDFRLVYLALHHIIKHRGNFLYDQEMSLKQGLDITKGLVDLFHLFFEGEDEHELQKLGEVLAQIIGKPLYRQEKASEMKTKMVAILPDQKEICEQLTKAILGLSANFATIFQMEGEKKECKFSLSNEEKCQDMMEKVSDNQQIQFEQLQKVYSMVVLKNILKESNLKTISDAFVHQYEEYKADQSCLKEIYRTLGTKEETRSMFKETGKGSYAAYSKKNSGDSNLEELYKRIRSDFKKFDERNTERFGNGEGNSKQNMIEAISLCSQKMQEGTFLLKPCNNQNGAIPNQLQVEELQSIIDHQKVYYPILATQEEKILQIARYRIPYYVGPLAESAKQTHGWVVRDKGAITPWNFDEKVDLMSSAKEFIQRMQNNCQYLYGESVLPKNSLVYSRYCVLNELNGISVNGKKLGKDLVQAAYAQLFSKHKQVSKSTFVKWLQATLRTTGEIISPNSIQGFQKEDGFASSLSSYLDFQRILPNNAEKDVLMIEELINWVTLFSDKTILRKQICQKYGQALTPKEIDTICKLNYKGWGRFSKKLLTGLHEVSDDGELGKQSVMDLLWETNRPFMQILYDPQYHFIEQIENYNAGRIGKINLDDWESVFETIQASPSVKKSVWQSLKIYSEITKIMGKPPRYVFLETTREEQEKKRTTSRLSKLQYMFKGLKKDSEFQQIIATFEENKEQKNQNLQNDVRLYLYYCQNGKCLYSGKPLDGDLRSYQIDHILPQSYIKDNSLDNLALVISKENQRKSDTLLLRDDIIQSQKPVWQHLKTAGLISNKKYNALIRQDMPDSVLHGFIQRQIVETSQTVSIISTVLMKTSPQVIVRGVRAGLSTGIRNKLGLYKIRGINDCHHAQDAFLACQVGRFLIGPFHRAEQQEKLIGLYRADVLEEDKLQSKQQEGFIVDIFTKASVPGWDGQKECQKLLASFALHDFFVTFKVEEQSGAFYNQQLLMKGKATVNAKNDKPRALYGGYGGENFAYFLVISYKKKKKQIEEMIGMPIRIVSLEKTKQGAIHDYLQGKYPGYTVLRDHIGKYQFIRYREENGKISDYYITSDKEQNNAHQLFLSLDTIRKMAHWKTIEDSEKKELFQILCDKMKKQFPCFENIASQLQNHTDDYNQLSDEKKRKCIDHLLTIMQANASRVDSFTDLSDEDKKGNRKTNKWGDVQGSRLGKTLKVDHIEFVDQSVTGLFERRSKIGIQDSGNH